MLPSFRPARAALVLSNSCCEIKTRIPRVAQSAIYLMDHANPLIPRGIFFADNLRSIGRAIIDYKDLKIVVGLIDHTLQRMIFQFQFYIQFSGPMRSIRFR